MCVFSAKIRSVSSTNIFARLFNGEQYLAYEMKLSSPQDVAMILPLPVDHTKGAKVSFIDLSGYPNFFADLEECFEELMLGSAAASMAVPSASLAVIKVGSFDASIVPSIADFSRLDQRFRLPSEIWQDLPDYRDYAFAVFKLRAGEIRIHPMALKFTSRFTDKIFFPTLHIHDGKVDAQAEFDHQLVVQGIGEGSEQWKKAFRPVADVMDFAHALQVAQLRDILDREQELFRYTIRGQQTNQDTFVSI